LNTNYRIKYTPEASNDYEKFNNFQKDQIDKAVLKVSQNPLPQNEGGYGKPLGNKQGRNLTGCCKIVLKKLGIRVVYELIRKGKTMEIIVVAARADEEVYDIAAKRISERRS
jgi:mRNA interferase RelE/StbE